VVEEFNENVLDGINRGVKFMQKSNGTLTNSVFKSMHQNVKDGTRIFAELTSSGSGLGINPLVNLYRNC